MTRKVIVVAAVAVLLAAVAGATAWWLSNPTGPIVAAASVPVDTATVVRTTLTTTTQMSGTLGYAGSYTLSPQLQGTLTALPVPGTVVSRGQSLYEVDGAAVYLFYGTRPAWRAFQPGMTGGRDVRQLEQNLTELGFGSNLTVDDTFTWDTEVAIFNWQRATGQPVTGRIDLGRVAFEPGPLRVESDAATLGAPAQPGQLVLNATSPDPVVTVPVPPTQRYLIRVGDAVAITVPSGAATTGRVAGISPVAVVPTDSSSAGQNGPPQAIVPAQVTLDHPSIAAGLDQVPVTISVTDQRATNVLAVPITALVAVAGGGYAVWVDPAAEPRQLVPVTPGLFTDTLVQVTGPALHAGTHVEVPAS